MLRYRRDIAGGRDGFTNQADSPFRTGYSGIRVAGFTVLEPHRAPV
jgi:hypothetical protein